MPNNPDTLVRDTKVLEELSISVMTLWRWERDPVLQFPQKVKIRNRNYRSRAALEAFKTRLLSEALTAPRRLIEPAASRVRTERIRYRRAN
jgi:predicted DNA-binding transcriptional regulator AlpA